MNTSPDEIVVRLPALPPNSHATNPHPPLPTQPCVACHRTSPMLPSMVGMSWAFMQARAVEVPACTDCLRNGVLRRCPNCARDMRVPISEMDDEDEDMYCSSCYWAATRAKQERAMQCEAIKEPPPPPGRRILKPKKQHGTTGFN